MKKNTYKIQEHIDKIQRHIDHAILAAILLGAYFTAILLLVLFR